MSLLIDVLLDVLAGGFGPSTNRGLILLSTAVGLALSVASGWLLATSFSGRNGPDWTVGILVMSLVIGAAGIFLGVLHWVREPNERALAVICLAANTAAVLVPVVSFAG